MKPPLRPRRPKRLQRKPRPNRADTRRNPPPGVDLVGKIASSGAAILLDLAVRVMERNGITLPTYAAKCAACRLVIQTSVPRAQIHCPSCGRELQSVTDPPAAKTQTVDATFERVDQKPPEPCTWLVYPAKGKP